MSKNNLICWEENKENKWEMVKDGDDTNVFLLNLMRNKLVNQHTVFIVPVSGFVSGIWLQPQTHKSNRVDFWNFHKDFGSEYDKPKADEITSEVVKSVHEQYNDDTKYGWISPEGQYYHCCYQGHVDLADKICFGMVDTNNSERYLEDHGWVKIYKPMTYDKYCLYMSDKCKITEEQMKILIGMKLEDVDGMKEILSR